MPPGQPSPEEFAHPEPLPSLYRAREFISDPAILRDLDSLIETVMNRVIKAKSGGMRDEAESDLAADAAAEIDDPVIRECLESPTILSVEELAALLKRRSKKPNGN